MMQKKEFKILSLDGGGMRGVASATYLNFLQQRIDPPLFKYFDLIVGTSTGGIIALGLASEIPVHEIVKFYNTLGKDIFKRSFSSYFQRPFNKPMYKASILETELKKTFGEEKELGSVKARVCIPTIDITNGKTVIFKTRHHKEYIRDFEIPIWQVARATSAAPTYFSPLITKMGTFVDGGLWANNPSVLGIAEAVKLGYSLEQIKILSIGTGGKTFYSDEKALTKVFSSMVGHFIPKFAKKRNCSVMDLISISQSWGANNISNYLCKNYERIDFLLPDSLDNDLAITKTDDLERIATEKAKESFTSIKEKFFYSEVEPFIPFSLEKGVV